MHHHTEISLVDEFRWVSPLHYLKNGGQNALLRCCMLQEGPPFLHYSCVVVLHSCILLPPVGHSSNHEYHCCQFTRQSSCVSNFYRTFKFFIWLSVVFNNCCFSKTKMVTRTLLNVTLYVQYLVCIMLVYLLKIEITLDFWTLKHLIAYTLKCRLLYFSLHISLHNILYRYIRK